MQPYIGYAFIVAVCLIVGLVAFSKVNPKTYPIILYGIGAAVSLDPFCNSATWLL